MNRTLHAYISRDLLRVTALALVAFTLVMTVFAIIEPLRKRGLASGQVGMLFAYTLPMMLSLTVPIAALFAGTIVYGRFSQDNELTACRASGVSTISLLKPALVLGAIVMVISMVLSNFVGPKMTELLARSLKANALGIVARELRTHNYMKERKRDSKGEWRTRIVHADAVLQRGNRLMLLGVVAADGKDAREMRVLAAARAYAQFVKGDEETFVGVLLEDPMAIERGGESIGREKSQVFSLPVPNPAEERPSWYNWNKLLRARREPTENSQVRGIMKAMRREMNHDMFHSDVVQVVQSGRPYDKLRDGRTVYVINGATAERALDGGAMLRSAPKAGIRVEVTVLRDGDEQQTVRADTGTVWADPEALASELFTVPGAISGESPVVIEMIGSIRAKKPGESWDDATRLPKWSVRRLAIPQDILERGGKVTSADIMEGNPILGRGLARLPDLKEKIVKLAAKIRGEIHSRLAFGLSCFLLVGIGAAMGLIFKGGQIISAFAIAVVPGSIVIVMIIMGKKMVTNPEVSQAHGIAVIWGGVLALALAQLIVYARLSRK